MTTFKPLTQILSLILLAIFCFTDMAFIHFLGLVFVLGAFDLLLDALIKAAKKE